MISIDENSANVEQEQNKVGSVNLGPLTPAQFLKTRISFKSLMISDNRKLKKIGKLWGCCCPFHPDKNPSFFVKEDDDAGCCYGCNWYGDIFKYVMDRTGCDFKGAYRHLSTSPSLEKSVAISGPAKVGNKTAAFEFTAGQKQEIARSTARICDDPAVCERIAVSRNWKPGTILRLAQSKHLGWGGDALNFIYQTGIKVRRWPGKEFYWWAGSGCLWRVEMLANASSVLLTEGEPDAITMIDAGFEDNNGSVVIAAPSASTFHSSWAELFRGKEVTICFDADDAGRKGAARVAEIIRPVASSIFDLNPEEVSK